MSGGRSSFLGVVTCEKSPLSSVLILPEGTSELNEYSLSGSSSLFAADGSLSSFSG